MNGERLRMHWTASGLAASLFNQVAFAQASKAPAGAAAPAAPWTVFGLQLGAPPTIPICQRKRMPNGQLSQFIYEPDPAQTCCEPDQALPRTPWRQGGNRFSAGEDTLIVRGNRGLTMVADGKIEGLIFDTLGHSNTNAIIAELTQKFGRPTSVTRTTASPSGIPMPAVHAEWQLKGIYVSYRSIDYNIDMGLLRIETPILEAMRMAQEQGREASAQNCDCSGCDDQPVSAAKKASRTRPSTIT